MSEDAWPKLGASAGIAAAVLLIIGFVFGPDKPPGFDDSAQEVQSYIADNRGEIQATLTFGFATLVAFLWFLGSVFYRLRAFEPSPRLSAIALAGGVTLATGGLVGSAAEAAAAYHVDVLDPGSVLAMWDVSIFGFLFLLAGFAVLAGATGVLALRTGALPKLLGEFSLLTAIYVFVVGLVGAFSETGAFSPSDGALGLIAFLLFIVWLLAMGASLMSSPTGEPTPSRGPARPAGGPTTPG
ncbi:MAG TPA: hypothetical protein VGF04_00590 [Solirubrobacterales bacterium]|jgi:hypothetical protein